MPIIMPWSAFPTIICATIMKTASGHSSFGYRSPKPIVDYIQSIWFMILAVNHIFILHFELFTCNSKLNRKNSVKLEAPSTHFISPSCNDFPVSWSMIKSLWACEIKYHIVAKSVQDPKSIIKYTKITNRHWAWILKF